MNPTYRHLGPRGKGDSGSWFCDVGRHDFLGNGRHARVFLDFGFARARSCTHIKGYAILKTPKCDQGFSYRKPQAQREHNLTLIRGKAFLVKRVLSTHVHVAQDSVALVDTGMQANTIRRSGGFS